MGANTSLSMKSTRTCDRCGKAVPPFAPDKLCLVCLFDTAIDADAGAAGDTDGPRNAANSLRAPATQTPPPNFGDYELLGELGRGGQGVVHRARHRRLERFVALKTIPPAHLAGLHAQERFHLEASTASRLDHPNIVPIYEVGERDGFCFYSMKLVEGTTLQDLVARGVTDAAACRHGAAILVKVAEAVHHAHQRGVLHRDLKPSNVLLDQEHEPYVSDFGLARQTDEDSSLTMSRALIGTPAYLAPEVALGGARQSTVAADVYGLGAILYQLLTGRPPFVGATVMETLRAVQDTEPTSPRRLNPAVPADLETICLKCLEKEPKKRYGTSQAIADDLARFLRHEPILARPTNHVERAWRWCRRKPALASAYAGVLALALVLVLGSPFAVYRINQERQRAEQGEMGARQKAYASDMHLAQQAIQADEWDHAVRLLDQHRSQGSIVGGQSSDASQRSPLNAEPPGWEWRYLWRQCQGDQRFTLGEHEGRATVVGVLADGTTAFSAGMDNAVRLWDLESGRQIGLLPHSDSVTGAAASPDGRWLATAVEKEAEGRPILLWDLATRTISAQLTTRTAHSTNFWLRPGSITFSPDSQWLAFATVWGGVRLWDVNARREVTNLPALTPDTGFLGVAFSPDTRILAYNADDYGAILLWDIVSRSLIGRLNGHESFVTSLAFSPDGKTLASISDDRTARLWNVVERRERFRFPQQRGEDGSLAFSPDGLTLALNGAGAGRVIQLVDTVTGRPKSELRGHLKRISSLAFFPNGQSLLSASADGTVRLWDVAPRAKEKASAAFPRNFISSDWRSYGPALCLSPDGCHLLTVHSNQTFSLWETLRLAEGAHHRLPFTNTAMAAVAPGGRLAAFASLQGEVVLWDVESSQSRFFARPGTNRIRRLVFSPDGRRLAGADDFKTPLEMAGSNDDPRRTVRVWEVATGQETHVLSPHGQFLWSLKFSADSQALLGATWRGDVQLWSLDGPNGANPSSSRAREPSTRLAGSTPIAAGFDISFWDTRTRQETDNFAPEAGWFPGIALSADGRRLAVGANDGRITIWDIAAHEVVATLDGHQESVTQLAFTPDGDHLVSVSKDQLRVWRAAPPAATDRRPPEQKQ